MGAVCVNGSARFEPEHLLLAIDFENDETVEKKMKFSEILKVSLSFGLHVQGNNRAIDRFEVGIVVRPSPDPKKLKMWSMPKAGGGNSTQLQKIVGVVDSQLETLCCTIHDEIGREVRIDHLRDYQLEVSWPTTTALPVSEFSTVAVSGSDKRGLVLPTFSIPKHIENNMDLKVLLVLSSKSKEGPVCNVKLEMDVIPYPGAFKKINVLPKTKSMSRGVGDLDLVVTLEDGFENKCKITDAMKETCIISIDANVDDDSGGSLSLDKCDLTMYDGVILVKEVALSGSGMGGILRVRFSNLELEEDAPTVLVMKHGAPAGLQFSQNSGEFRDIPLNGAEQGEAAVLSLLSGIANAVQFRVVDEYKMPCVDQKATVQVVSDMVEANGKEQGSTRVAAVALQLSVRRPVTPGEPSGKLTINVSWLKDPAKGGRKRKSTGATAETRVFHLATSMSQASVVTPLSGVCQQQPLVAGGTFPSISVEFRTDDGKALVDFDPQVAQPFELNLSLPGDANGRKMPTFEYVPPLVLLTPDPPFEGQALVATPPGTYRANFTPNNLPLTFAGKYNMHLIYTESRANYTTSPCIVLEQEVVVQPAVPTHLVIDGCSQKWGAVSNLSGSKSLVSGLSMWTADEHGNRCGEMAGGAVSVEYVKLDSAAGGAAQAVSSPPNLEVFASGAQVAGGVVLGDDGVVRGVRVAVEEKSGAGTAEFQVVFRLKHGDHNLCSQRQYTFDFTDDCAEKKLLDELNEHRDAEQKLRNVQDERQIVVREAQQRQDGLSQQLRTNGERKRLQGAQPMSMRDAEEQLQQCKVRERQLLEQHKPRSQDSFTFRNHNRPAPNSAEELLNQIECIAAKKSEERDGILGTVAGLGMCKTEELRRVLSKILGQGLRLIAVQTNADEKKLYAKYAHIPSYKRHLDSMWILPVERTNACRGQVDRDGKIDENCLLPRVSRRNGNQAPQVDPYAYGFLGFAVNLVEMKPEHQALRKTVMSNAVSAPIVAFHSAPVAHSLRSTSLAFTRIYSQYLASYLLPPHSPEAQRIPSPVVRWWCM